MVTITVALDGMGGDHGPRVVVPAAKRALEKHPDLHLILVGDEKILSSYVRRHHLDKHSRLHIHHTSQTVDMDESPSHALRNKKDSSMRVAINLVKQQEAEACVSAGNTGALMATARFVLKTLPGIDRPAILSELPTVVGKTRILDLGANVDSCAEHLFQFAVMGSVVASAIDNIPNPRIGLLNIGVEDMKGNDQVKRTAQLLSESKGINYIGYVEGDGIFQGVADVVVCDGFVGNIALKTSEGVAKLLIQFTRDAFGQNVLTKMLALLVMPILKNIKKRADPAHYNGATLVGLNGIVIKSHGGASMLAYTHAIDEAVVEVKKNVLQLIPKHIATLLNQEGFL